MPSVNLKNICRKEQSSTMTLHRYCDKIDSTEFWNWLYRDIILYDNSIILSFRWFCVTAGTNLQQVMVHVFQFSIVHTILGFYSPCLKKVLAMFPSHLQTCHLSQPTYTQFIALRVLLKQGDASWQCRLSDEMSVYLSEGCGDCVCLSDSCVPQWSVWRLCVSS